jgi:hypothetical protein
MRRLTIVFVLLIVGLVPAAGAGSAPGQGYIVVLKGGRSRARSPPTTRSASASRSASCTPTR